MQTATGNIINDRAWAAESLPGLECRRWTGFIDVEDTDIAGRWYAVSLPNSDRSNELRETEYVIVLPVNFKVNHFAISPYVPLLAGASVDFSLRNPAFLENEVTNTIVSQTPRLNLLSLRTTVGPSTLLDPPYLAHQVWVRLRNAPKWSGRLTVSLGATRPCPVFNFFDPANPGTGALIWGERRDGTIGLIPGSEGLGDDGIRPRGRDFSEPTPFSVSPAIVALNPSQSVGLIVPSPATWTLAGGGSLSTTTGSSNTYTAPATTGTAVITAVSTQGPPTSVVVPVTVSPPPTAVVAAVTLVSDQPALLVGGSAALVATVAGTGPFNSDVTYSVAGPGSLSGSGLSRTLSVLGAGTIVVTATSVGDPTKSASVTVVATAPAPVVASISLVSNSYSITTLQTANLLAAVTTINGGSTAVTYTFTGPATLTGSGLARTLTPTGIGQITVTATSVQDPTKTSAVSISVTEGSLATGVTLTGSPAAGSPFSIINLVATVMGTGTYSPAVTLQLVSGPGTLATGSSSGAITNGTLTYGSTPATGTTVIRARSVADPTKFADLTIALVPDPLVTSVTVTPSASTVTGIGSTFTATAVVNPSGRPQAVTWSVVSGPATLAVSNGIPTFTVTGAGPVVVTATSVANPGISGSATITAIVPAVVTSVSLTSDVTSIAGVKEYYANGTSGGTFETASISATVAGTGPFNSGVVYSVTGPGVLTGSGLSRTLAPTGEGTIVVTATSVGDPTKSASVTIAATPWVRLYRVTNENPGLTELLNPPALRPGEVAFIRAVVLGVGQSPYVNFAVYAGNGSVYAFYNPVIKFTANPTTVAGSATLQVSSITDTAKYSSITIQLLPALAAVTSVSLVSDQLRLGNSQTATITATVAGTGAFDSGTTYTVTGPGTLSGSGLSRTLTPTGPGTVTVTATSVSDPSKSASVSVTAFLSEVTRIEIINPGGFNYTSGVREVTISGIIETTNGGSTDATFSIISGPAILSSSGVGGLTRTVTLTGIGEVLIGMRSVLDPRKSSSTTLVSY